MALMILIDNLIESFDRGEYVIGIFLDFSKAFDTVDITTETVPLRNTRTCI